MQGDAGAGNRRAARSTVRLKHVAIDADGAFTPLRKIRDGAQAASDETLDFLGAAALLPLDGFATHAGVGRARQHSILCREPTAALALEKGRHALFHRGRAQYERLAALDQRRAFGVSRIVTRDREAAQLVGAPAALAVDHCYLRPVNDWIIAAGTYRPPPCTLDAGETPMCRWLALIRGRSHPIRCANGAGSL